MGKGFIVLDGGIPSAEKTRLAGVDTACAPCLWAVEMGWSGRASTCPVSLGDFGRVKSLDFLCRDARDRR